MNNKYELILENDNASKFIIHFAGGDLYWTMLNYYDNNEFLITQDNILFSHLENLFSIINNNSFEWMSEAYGIMEDSNKLTILKNNDKFIIKFFQNPNNKFNMRNTCAICFCLSGSRNQDIANMFSVMLYECIEKEKNKSKILKNNSKS